MTIGIIAGSGELPRQVIAACDSVFVIAFEGITEPETVAGTKHKWVHIGKVGKIIKTLRSESITEIILAGRVGRPSLSELKLDFSGVKLLAKFRKLKSHGDDHIFSTIIAFLEKSGFTVMGAEDVLSDLIICEGVLGNIKPDKTGLNDIELGMKAALSIGKLDIGQAVIIQQGQILGVEGAEGTDKLVRRCKELHNEGVGGVLVKMKKPEQDTRVDLPSIGVYTINNAHESGLRGIAVEAGGSLVINKDEVIKKADELGMFVVGVETKC